MSLDEVKSRAQKGMAAEQKFEEASALLKQAESLQGENSEKLKYYDMMQAVKSGDPDANKLMAKEILGVDDEGLSNYMDNIQDQFNLGVEQETGGAPMNELPEDIKRSINAIKAFTKPLEAQGYSMEQVGEILSTGITKQAGANRNGMLRQAADKSPELKSVLKKDPERVERLIAGFANERQGSGQLTDAIIQLAVQDAEKVLGGATFNKPESQPDIALGDLGATLDKSYSRAKERTMPNMYDDRETADAAMTTLLANLSKEGDEGSAEA